jgi:hypothetical protein
MATRNPGNDLALVRQQYDRLKEAVDAFYAGKEVQALNIAITMRVLIHETDRSRSLLSRVNPNYWDLTIHHRPVLNPRAIFAVPVTIQIGGDGTRKIIRTNLDSPSYQLVPLRQWWNAEYQPLGKLRLSKKDIILTVADKDGGAHIDAKVPDGHATLSEPPFRIGVMMKNGEGLFSQPNLAYNITAQCGYEMQAFLERHFLR